MNRLSSFLRYVFVIAIIATASPLPLSMAGARVQPSSVSSTPNQTSDEPYILVGGQNGSWFGRGQAPRLYKISLQTHSVTQLTPVSGLGTVWTGSWNGSQWLISGWGKDPGTNGSDPYIYLYDGQHQIVAGSLDRFKDESSWHGGDVFAASYNGSEWLLSGLGSDSLASGLPPSNHMSLAVFDGYKFTDISPSIPSKIKPNQWDEILYANAWNGRYWLIGGGWAGNIIPSFRLFRYDGSKFTDLSDQLSNLVLNGAVQSIQWNGDYWLIGGVGFLVKYDGQQFTDLTAELSHVIAPHYTIHTCCNAVNALAWNGSEWMIAGGTPVSITYNLQPLNAWAVTYDGHQFTNLSPLLPTEMTQPAENSSILTATYTDNSWFLAGYADGHGMLLSYKNSTITDLSYLIKRDMSTVNWVGGRTSTSNERLLNSGLEYFVTANYLRFLFGISLAIIIVGVAILTLRPSIPHPKSRGFNQQGGKSKLSRPSKRHRLKRSKGRKRIGAISNRKTS